VNTETSFQESSNTRAETDVLPVIEERTGELSPERTRQQGPEEEEEDKAKMKITLSLESLHVEETNQPG
jgi:hypothetical protein